MLSRPGWLVTYRNKVPPPGVEPGHVTHPSTNRARRRVTSLIRPTPLPLRHAANSRTQVQQDGDTPFVLCRRRALTVSPVRASLGYRLTYRQTGALYVAYTHSVGKVLDNVRLHADDVTVRNDEVGGGKMLHNDAELDKVAALAPSTPDTPGTPALLHRNTKRS